MARRPRGSRYPRRMALPRGIWVTVEDLYDHDQGSIGPFPDEAAAHAYCDAVNGAQLKQPKADLAPSAVAPTAVGVWNLATCDGYDVDARLRAMLAAPDSIPLDPDGLAARHGARPEHAWREEARAAIGVRECWCAALRAGEVPDVGPDALDAYLHRGLDRERALFATAEHFGDADLMRCRVCGAALLHLLVELEGMGNAIHHYYTALSDDALAALAAGTLDGDTCEAWLGLRPGYYRAGSAARTYARATVGYLGVDHRLEG